MLNGVKYINEYAFYNCYNLETVHIPVSVLKFDNWAFDYNSNLVFLYDGTWEQWNSIERVNDQEGYYLCVKLLNLKFTYTENNDKTLTITGAEGTPGGIITIPDTINGKKVTAIADSAFRDDKIIKLTIGDNVKSIGRMAFANNQLLSVTFGKGLETIGDYAFYNAIYLTNYFDDNQEIYLHPGLKTIGKYAFANSEWISDVPEKITIPLSTEKIGKKAFANFYRDYSTEWYYEGTLQQWLDIFETEEYSDYITENVHTAGGPGYIKLNNALNEEWYKMIGWPDASGDITIPSEFRGLPIRSINGVFAGNENITSVTVPECVTGIDSSFIGCTNLKTAVINGHVYNIDSSFNGCTSLETVYLPFTLGSIGGYTFEGCFSLKDVYYESQHNWENLVDIASGNDLLTEAEIHFEHDWGYEIREYWRDDILINGVYITGKSDISETLEFPSEMYGIPVTVIGLYTPHDDFTGAFEGFTSVKKVIIPEGVIEISYNTFKDCTGIKEVVLPESLLNIESQAFYGCSGIENINLPTTLKWIGVESFKGCTSLKSVTTPENECSIGNYAFEGCTGIEKIVIRGNEGLGYRGTFKDCTGVKEIILPGDYYFGVNESVLENVPRNAYITVAKDSVTYRDLLDMGFTNFSTLSVLRRLDVIDVTVSQGDSVAAIVIPLPDDITNLDLEWTVADPTIASVTEKGVVKGLKTGETILTVKDRNTGISAKANITVIYPAGGKLTAEVTPELGKAGLESGSIVKMTVSMESVGEMDAGLFEYTSSNESAASVYPDGTIIANNVQKPTAVMITAKLKNDVKNRKAVISFKVIPQQTETLEIIPVGEEVIDDNIVISKTEVTENSYIITLHT
ncbi:MAG: leucine-rich repeat protein, partial [Oscillospiraceae bacterium]|nr:leucine-rich repeat protein [Oscillospiraceae bacterium]